jgi:hypothetical protein
MCKTSRLDHELSSDCYALFDGLTDIPAHGWPLCRVVLECFWQGVLPMNHVLMVAHGRRHFVRDGLDGDEGHPRFVKHVVEEILLEMIRMSETEIICNEMADHADIDRFEWCERTAMSGCWLLADLIGHRLDLGPRIDKKMLDLQAVMLQIGQHVPDEKSQGIQLDAMLDLDLLHDLVGDFQVNQNIHTHLPRMAEALNDSGSRIRNPGFAFFHDEVRRMCIKVIFLCSVD